MIGIDGQYQAYFALDGGSGEREIGESMFHSWKSTVRASALLPSFEMVFRTMDDSFARDLESGAILRAGVGRDSETINNMEWKPTGIECTRLATEEMGIRVTGLLNQATFLRDRGNYSSGRPVSGIEAITEVMERAGFSVDASPAKSEDSQLWVQPGWSNKRFVLHAWLHSKLSGQIPLLGFGTNGRVMIRALNESSPPGKTIGPVDAQIPVLGNYKINDRGGFNSAWAGDHQGFYETNLRTAIDYWRTEEDATGGVETSATAYEGVVRPESWMGAGVLNHNHDPEYWKTYVRNLSFLTHFGGARVTCETTQPQWETELFDRMTFLDPNPGGGSAGGTSGSTVVTKIVHSVRKKAFSTVFELSRPALNLAIPEPI